MSFNKGSNIELSKLPEDVQEMIMNFGAVVPDADG